MILSGDFKDYASATYKWGCIVLTTEGRLYPGPGYWFKTKKAAVAYAKTTWRHYAIARREH